ncbi:titin homolog [Papilio machaon]|uniref:titin homolog n=1 Tax=Papilio machaon TaxID=76193 RepID=UPI001E6650F2|nr:titin homolog [Papilio machaon]
MGNQHSASHASHRPRKNVHWKSAGRPAPPGKPHITPILTDDEPNAITLRWAAPAHDGGAPLQGYQVECNRLGAPDWIRTAPPVVARPELVLTGLGPPHRYQFRVAALNIVGRSDYSEISDILTVSSERGLQEAPVFHQHLEDVTVLENEKTEFRVVFTGTPAPTIGWFKDDYEIFSSRRTAITTNESSSVLIFHQTLASDEGEIKCTATNRIGHAVSKARLVLEAAPKLRYPRQYEDGLLYEINETVFLKTTIVGKPTPSVEWRHDGQPIEVDDRVEITTTPKFSLLKIHSARRSDRGEYQIQARNNIGEDTASFLVTITAPPDPPRRVTVTRQVDKSVTLDWEPPEDDGGCRIGNYVVEYYRNGWNVWLKATTSRKTNVTLFDLIEGSEYRFRVKAESPYGMSLPSVESPPVRIPGRAVDMEFLAVESRIINQVLTREEGEEPPVSPVPRRKRVNAASPAVNDTSPPRKQKQTSPRTQPEGSNEFMLVLYPESNKSAEKAEKRKSFQLDLEDALSPPPISLSAPELSTRNILPFKALRNAVSSTELLHERAMARFYKAIAMKEEQTKRHDEIPHKHDSIDNDIPYKPDANQQETSDNTHISKSPVPPVTGTFKKPEIFIKTDSIENKQYKYTPELVPQDSETSENKWQQMSFDEDYTASTVSTDGEYSDEDSLSEEIDRLQYNVEEETYNPRNKITRPSPVKELSEEKELENELENELEEERPKLSPLPDPNFIPKPILKRREADNLNNLHVNKSERGENQIENNSKKEKITLLKRITKIPVQKPFNLPKILNKKEKEKTPKSNIQNSDSKIEDNIENINDKVVEESKTVIDYYGNIVKEYGSHKKSTTPLYLSTDDLKTVAEKQQLVSNVEEEKESPIISEQKNMKSESRQKPLSKESLESKPRGKVTPVVAKTIKTVNKNAATQPESIQKVSPKVEKSIPAKEQAKSNIKPPIKPSQNTQIVLKKTERATIIIPIDYQKLEERAKRNVRTAIDYTVDVCLLLLAFWVYFFRDERLAIPILILIIYRQLQETFLLDIPEWLRTHAPEWLKKKTS